MAATNTTTKLGLPLYENNDKPDWKDTNAGFESLDARITALENTVAVLTNGTGLTVAQYAKLGVVATTQE